ncbi:MAG TPA: hypothetical protein VIT85_06555 [Solirubrobacterales bacterium]
MLFAVPTAASAAEILYTTPGGGPTADCAADDPCDLETAVAEAEDGDSVSVGPGEYGPADLPVGPLQISKEIDLGGTIGSRPLIRTTSTSFVQVTPSAGPGTRIHDLAFAGAGPLLIERGTAERVFVSYSSEDEVIEEPGACFIRLGSGYETATIRDSVCWSNESEGPSTADAVRISVADEGPEKVVTLRNVTAIAAGRGGDGLEAFAGGDAKLLVDAKNLISRAANGFDIAADVQDVKVFPRVLVRTAGSNYATVQEINNEIDVTDAGTEGNSTAAPLFVDAPTGDFHEAAGSPTLDAGVDDPLDGGVDIDGASRAQPSCLGPHAKPLPDAGAYERPPEGQCPNPPEPPPPPPEPPKPQFRILQVKVGKGSGSVKVEVPAAGTAAVAGSGLKFLTRTTTGPGVVTIPIRSWAITLVRLNKFGKLRLRMKVKFEPSGAGVPRQKVRTIVFKRGRPPA